MQFGNNLMAEKITKPKVVVSPNLKVEKIFLDKHGNQVDSLKGGRIIKKFGGDDEAPASIPTPPVPQPTQAEAVPIDYENMSLKELRNMIDEKEDELDDLKKLLKKKVKELRQQLDELEGLE